VVPRWDTGTQNSHGLGCHCAVFKDMLSVPQPSVLEESQMIEGCPVIEMTDEAKDLHHFLMAIHQHG
jgi:hypothetical protein